VEIRVHIAVMIVAADPARADPAAADAVAQKAVAGGHSVVARISVPDKIDAIRAQLEVWIKDPEIDVVIVTAAPDAQHAPAAMKPLVHEAVPGFTDLFRWLAFQEIGASAMLASAEAARCGTTFVFVLPAAANAVATAMDKLILPQLDVRSTTRNLVAQMPRLQALVPSAPVAVVVGEATEAVPQQVTLERTESGPGLTPRLPAQNIVRKEPAPAKPKAPKPEESTRVIPAAQLERKLAQSNQHDAVTKPSIDIAKMLPRMPPGADLDDEDGGDTADFTDVISPHPFTRPKTPTPAQPQKAVQIPVRTKPPSNVPMVLKKDEKSGRVVIGKAKPPVDLEAPTVPSKTPAKIADAMKAIPSAVERSQPAKMEAAKPEPKPEPAKPELAAHASGTMNVEDSQVEEVDETVEDSPPPPPRRPATTPPPVPIIAEIRARTREPTPLPLLPKRSKEEEDALPRGKFIMPAKRRRSGRKLVLFLALAVLAAAGGIAFVRFVVQKPETPKPPELAVAPAIDAAEVAPVVPPVDAAEDMPEIDLDPGSAAVAPPAMPDAGVTKPKPPTTPAAHHPVVVAAHADAGVVVDAAAAAAVAEQDGCDEVSCLTNHYEKACCAKWKPTDDEFRPHVGPADALDKVMVREAIEGVKPRVIACGEKNAAKGIVKVAVAVGGDGAVKSVSVVETPLPALGDCVAAAVKEAQFAKTTRGGSFNYPFAF
jgi:molybdopterin adenylyltransferase